MLDLLPAEIIIQVFTHLGYRDLLACHLVSVSTLPFHLNYTATVPGVPSLSYNRAGECFLPVHNRPRCLWHAKWSSWCLGSHRSLDDAS